MVYYTKSRHSHRFDKLTKGLERAKILIFVLLIISGLAYFWQINSLSTRGFKIKELEKDIQQLKSDNQKLELEVTNEQSMFNLDEQIKSLNMVELTQVEYLRPTGPAVAVK